VTPTPTLEDVAARAGVSPSTVSRALRNSPLVAASTRDRVLTAAQELSFSVSRVASSLATGRLGRVAVLISGRLDAWFNGSVADGLYEGLSAEGYELSIYRILTTDDRARFFATLPARRNADALVVISFALTAAERQSLKAMGIPVVYVNERVRGMASVAIDDVSATRAGVRHLINLGHRWPAFIRVENRTGFTYSALSRLDGYRAELAAAGAPPEATRVVTAVSPDGGAGVAATLLGWEQRPTSVVAESDEVAMSLIGAWRGLGLRVPEDLSVLGFDNHHLAEAFGLSTIAQPVRVLGERAAQMALALIEGRRLPRRDVVVPTQLVLRRSTAPPSPNLTT
jgi:LacI family transcriptional regulator, repressor for deo operon, udp, cdd, tsx, nupC, and nupG